MSWTEITGPTDTWDSTFWCVRTAFWDDDLVWVDSDFWFEAPLWTDTTDDTDTWTEI